MGHLLPIVVAVMAGLISSPVIAAETCQSLITSVVADAESTCFIINLPEMVEAKVMKTDADIYARLLEAYFVIQPSPADTNQSYVEQRLLETYSGKASEMHAIAP